MPTLEQRHRRHSVAFVQFKQVKIVVLFSSLILCVFVFCVNFTSMLGNGKSGTPLNIYDGAFSENS